MGRKKLSEERRQSVLIQTKVTTRFKRGLDEAITAAGEPGLGEFLKKAAIAFAKQHGVKIER